MKSVHDKAFAASENAKALEKSKKHKKNQASF